MTSKYVEICSQSQEICDIHLIFFIVRVRVNCESTLTDVPALIDDRKNAARSFDTIHNILRPLRRNLFLLFLNGLRRYHLIPNKKYEKFFSSAEHINIDC